MERAVQMKRNLNVSFLEAFVRLDVLCSQKFGVKHGGVTEYINRLINARFAPERDEILPALVEYRNIRNRLVHEEGELAEEGRVSKKDVEWRWSFAKSVEKKRDPLSVYLRKARRYVRRRTVTRVLLVVFSVALIAAAIALYFALMK